MSLDAPQSGGGRVPERTRAFGHEFRDPTLLRHALTHRSFCAENDGAESNERLEFLGDAVLGLAVTADIFAAYPDLPEGQLAKLRASVVNTASLAAIALDHDLGEGLRLGRGEELSGGRTKESILADAFEAVIGAVFVDAGWEQARATVLEALEDVIAAGATMPGRGDFKTQLQELVAQLGLDAPSYRITGSGPDHQRWFVARVALGGRIWGEGEGSSKKRAEQASAEAALGALRANYRAELAALGTVHDDGPGGDAPGPDQRSEKGDTGA